jgi:serine/threonine protein kinase
MASLPIPRLLAGRFAIQRQLGTGAFADVFVAQDRKQQRVVALKVLRDARKASACAQFQREYATLARIVHPNLASHYEFFQQPGACFFSMELVEGLDWVSYLRRDVGGQGSVRAEFVACSSAGVERLRNTLPQLVAGVASAHAAGLVHGDLKPDNVRVTYAGRLVVLDYGLWAGLECDPRAALTGTPAYMAPEQWERAARRPANDWYAVGVMLFEALTGALPFAGTGEEVLVRKRSVNAPRASSVVARVPADLDELCAELLRTDPEQRPTSEQLLGRFH